MKNRLLAAMALCCATSSTMPLWAGNWEKPTVQITTFDDAGGTYYVYHPATQLFLTQGNEYGTQASLGETGLKTIITNDNDPILENVSGKLINFPEATGNNDGRPFYLFIADATKAYVDHREQGHCCWKITKNASGDTYRIKVVDEDPVYGAEFYPDCYLGWYNNDNKPVTEEINNTVVRPLVNKDQEGFTNAELDWQFVAPEAYDAYVAKKQLFEELTKAEEAGFTDYATWESVYNNPSATVEELTKAVEELHAAVEDFAYSQATPENPYNVTKFLTNPNFDTNPNSNGWTIVRDPVSGQDNFQYKTDRDYPTSDPDPDAPAFSKFWERWNPNPNQPNWSMTQEVTGLVKGKYRLTAHVLTNYADPSGMFVFANGGLGEQRGEATVPGDNTNRVAHPVSVEFTVVSDKVSLGFRTVGFQGQWSAVDNFKLEYIGAMSGGAKGVLEETLAKATEYRDNNEGTYSLKGEEKFRADIELAEKALAASDVTEDSLMAVNTILLNRMDSVSVEIKAYVDLPGWLSGEKGGAVAIRNSYEPYWELEFPKLDEFISITNEAYSTGEWDPAEISIMSDTLTTLFQEDVKSLVVAGKTTDLYGLMTNPAFDSNGTGWNWTGSGASVNANSNGVGEAYAGSAGSTFDIYQEIKGLPNGAYKISMNGFWRPTNNAGCAAAWGNDSDPATARLAMLYGNEAMTPLVHVYSEGSAEPFVTKSDGSTNDYFVEALSYYVPNDRASTDVAFTAGLYKNEVICVVTDGVLRFGVKQTDKNQSLAQCWGTLDNFKLNYMGQNVEGYLPTVTSLVSQANGIVSNQLLITTDDALEKLGNAIVTGSGISASSSIDDCVKAIEEIKEAIAFNDSAVAAIETFTTYAMSVDTRIQNGEFENYSGTDNFLNVSGKIIDKVLGVQNGEMTFANIDEVNKLSHELTLAITELFMSDTDQASKDNPVEVTGVMSNPRFETETSEGTMQSNGSGWNGIGTYDDLLVEFYNRNFDMYQTIEGLKAGYYKLVCNGFYRAGEWKDAVEPYKAGTEEITALVYATTPAGWDYVAPLASIFDCAQPKSMHEKDVSIGAYLTLEGSETTFIPNSREGSENYFMSGVEKNEATGKYEGDGLYLTELYFEVAEGQTSINLGVKKDVLIKNDWAILDNFRLYYFGAGAENCPDGVESVENGTASVVSSTYYTLGGAQVAKPTQHGFYIRKDKMSDGTEKTVKFMVK